MSSWRRLTSTSSIGPSMAPDRMPVQSNAELLAQLHEAAQRMLEVRAAADALRATRLDPEPFVSPLPIALTEPQPVFSGQPVRPDVT